MGAAIAESFAAQGAEVHLVLGKGAVKPKNPAIYIHPVVSAREMFEKASALHPSSDVVIFAAAVADYAPKYIAEEKIKKAGDAMTIELVKNVDIAFTLGKEKQPHQIHVGFALETENEEFHAKEKLGKKNFDLIVLNSMRDSGAGFQTDTNKVRIFSEDGSEVSSEVLPKTEIAKLILERIKQLPVKI